MSERAAGILLHPTSLPGRFGIGDLGPEAERFLDWARAAGQGWWQILPLGPPARGNSPYTALSAFAGNPLLISPELLRREGLLAAGDLDAVPTFAGERVDFERLVPWKERLLRRSWELFERRAPAASRDRLHEFLEAPEQRRWLDEWTLFAALRARYGLGWWRWEPGLAVREASALDDARRALADEVAFQAYLQFQFTVQWRRLADAAHRRGLRILGDLPIYVALDSADVWSRRELFDLDDRGRPRAVAGVPPDAFSDDGQLWGHPLYRWDRVAAGGFAWWIERIRADLRRCDELRLDHFRGYEAYWRVAGEAETAAEGAWVAGPGRALFEALREALGRLPPLVAEDLGVITPEVEALRRELELPGTRVLHFAFDEPDSEHLPHRFESASVVYTGTHDNDTTAGWYQGLDASARDRLRRYAGLGGEAGAGKVEGAPWALIRLAYTSVAERAVVPVQDVLGLGSEARMNVPAVAEGNWAWRLRSSQLTPEVAARLRALAEISGRIPARGPARSRSSASPNTA